jgi:hypothetical protein
MSKTGTVVVADRREEHLSFTLQASEGVAVENSVSVALKFSAVGTFFLLTVTVSTFFVNAFAGVFAEDACFSHFDLFTYCHSYPSLKSPLYTYTRKNSKTL